MTERGDRLAEAFARELPRTDDHAALRAAAAAVLRPRVRYGTAVWATLDPLTSMWTSCVLDGFERDLALERAIFDNEYRVPDVLKLRDLAGRRSGDGVGVLSQATNGDPAASARFRDVFAPLGVTDELRLVFSVDGTAWGALVLLATDGRFSRETAEDLRALSRPFARRLRGSLLARTAAADRPTAAVLCDDRGRVLDLSADAAAVLGTAPEEVPAAVGAAVTRFVADGTADSVAAWGSAWLSLRCAWLGGRVLLTVDRIDPHRLADVLISAAGLTPRERAVLESVLGGATARVAAAGLSMSEHTLNDHLKRIFEKFGVGSRAELVAHLFTEHYEALHTAGAAPSARGHFLEDGAQAGG